MIKTLDPPESFFKTFKTFLKQNLKKRRCDVLATGFATFSQIANHCQIQHHVAS